jgi:hypothetical protein
MRKAIFAGLAWLMLLNGGFAAVQNNAPSNPAATKASAAPAKPSDTDIAAARTSRKVWVNLDTGIYHKGGRWYGKTKNGKFMTTDDAKKAGYKPAKRD